MYMYIAPTYIFIYASCQSIQAINKANVQSILEFVFDLLYPSVSSISMTLC